MDENFILYINNRIVDSFDKYKLSLANGKVGICLYFYYLSRMNENSEYEEIAEKMLDNIIDNLPPYESINTSYISALNGLAGIAIGMDYLLKQNFIEGNTNEILKDIDDIIFKKIVFEESKFSEMHLSEQIYLLYYLYIRYIEQKDENGLFIFSELIIKVIETVNKKIDSAFFHEPLSFSINYMLPTYLFLVSKIISLHIYNYRINKILDQYIYLVCSTFPTSQANRLFLLWGVLSLNEHYKSPKLEKHIKLLQSNIDVTYILNNELKNTQLYLFNGVSLVFFLLHYINKNFPDNRIDFDSQEFYKRIVNSELWDDYKKCPYAHGMIEGISGILLTLSYIKKQDKV